MSYESRNHLLGWMINKAVPLLNIFRQGLPWSTPLASLRSFSKSSWGNEIYWFLTDRGMSFLPKYEHHDALHVLLGYDTSVLGEARLQAFMVGNRTPTFAGRGLYHLARMLLRERKVLLALDRDRGTRTPPIDWLGVEGSLNCDLEDIRLRWQIVQMPHEETSAEQVATGKGLQPSPAP